MTGDVEPLEPGLWFRRMEMIAEGELGCVENSLRHAAHLALLTPLRFRQHVGLAVDEDAFEALLAVGEFDTAARHLLPPALATGMGPREEPISAAIKSRLMNRTFYGSGETIAIAILDAWTACVLALRTHSGPS